MSSWNDECTDGCSAFSLNLPWWSDHSSFLCTWLWKAAWWLVLEERRDGPNLVACFIFFGCTWQGKAPQGMDKQRQILFCGPPKPSCRLSCILTVSKQEPWVPNPGTDVPQICALWQAVLNVQEKKSVECSRKYGLSYRSTFWRCSSHRRGLVLFLCKFSII